MGDLINSTTEWLPKVAGAALTGGLVTFMLSRQFERTGERRKLYASAYKAALGWQEMLYRVRRRKGGIDCDQKLVDAFHDLQEDLNYYQGILSSESSSIGKSYSKFIKTVKDENVTLIQEAWEMHPRKPSDGTPKDEKHPNIGGNAEKFLSDIRLWLKWWQLPKLVVYWRNRR
jgi:hypothetical protein